MIPAEILDSLTRQLAGNNNDRVTIISSGPLSGGCINHVHKITTSAGTFCIKFNNKDQFPRMFEAESEGLAALEKASEIRVPGVIFTGHSSVYSYILLEFIQPAGMITGFMRDFGRSLARLHRHTSGLFGFSSDNYMGALPQSNREHPDWLGFFIGERLEKQAGLAVQKGYLSARDMEHFSRLYTHLKDLLPAEPPSLLHGDLWSGNYMVSEKGRACLIDPAVYYGHREVDLAMTTLFGGFDRDFYSAYEEEFPLEKGWRERLDIYNLYPLLIHLNLFGAGYLGSVREIIKRF